MDELTANLGQLSTEAREWTPGGFSSSGGSGGSGQQLQQQSFGSAPNSPLRPAMPGTSASVPEWDPNQGRVVSSDSSGAGVKEFVPGVGLTSAAASAGAPQEFVPQHLQQQQQQLAPDEPAPTMTTSSTTGAPPPPATALTSPRTLHSLGLPEDLWAHYRDLDMEASRQMDPEDARHRAVPAGYVNGYPLDHDEQQQPGISNKKRSSFGYPTMVFRVISREDGRTYCIRRLDSVRCVSHKIAGGVRDMWVNAVDPSYSAAAQQSHVPPPRLLDHPNIVRLYRAFVSQRAVFFVHRYHPGARTLRERYGGGVPLPEDVIWSIITQLVGLIKSVHSANLAVRTLQMNHILCTTEAGVGAAGAAGTPIGGRVRIRANCIGIPDALEFEARKPLADLQREDMRALGRIILSLATGTELTPTDCTDQTLSQCEQYVGSHYGSSLISLAMALVRPRNMNNDPPTIYDVAGMVAQRAFDELSAAQTAVDRVDEALAGEYEAGRTLRLLLKLGFINERPEFGVDARWSETGDNYVLKLFRDYVFHQADGNGRPVVDLGHVITAVNKLDAADEEKIVLASRDGKNIIVVSFADVARCLENAYGELCDGSVPAPDMGQMGGGGPRGF